MYLKSGESYHRQPEFFMVNKEGAVTSLFYTSRFTKVIRFYKYLSKDSGIGILQYLINMLLISPYSHLLSVFFYE